MIAQGAPAAHATVEVGRARGAYVMFLAFVTSIYVQLPQLVPPAAALATGKLLVGMASIALAWSCVLEGRKFRLGLGAGGGALYVFFALAALSAIGSFAPDDSKEALGEAAKYLAGFVVAANVLDTRERVRGAMATIVAASLVPAIGAIVAFVQGRVVEDRAVWIGAYHNSNFLAYLLVVSVPLALALREEVTREQTWWLLRRWLWLGAVGVLCAGVLVTASRGGALGLLAVLGVWFGRNLLAGRIALGAIGAVLVALVAAPTNPLSRAETRKSLSGEVDLSAKGRLDAWRTGFNMVWQHPTLGVGVGAFIAAYDRFAPGDAERAKTAHNSYVMVAAELGIPALLAFGFTLGAALVALGRRREPGVPVRPMEKGVQTGLFGFLVCSVTGGFAFTWPLYFLLGAAAALVGRTRA